jgi:hypothetical protein
MTETELLMVLGNKDCPLIQHQNMKDVAFFPMTIELGKEEHSLFGYWYSNVLEDIMGDSFGNPLREIITIKKKDLELWQIKKKI